MRTSEIPREVKKYFNNGAKRITKVIPDDNYTLTVYFDNKARIYDMSDCLHGVFEILKDKHKFNEVFIDEFGNLAWDIDNSIDSNVNWNNRIDICKDAIYIDSLPKQ